MTPPVRTVGEALREAGARLAASPLGLGRHEALVLLQHVLGLDAAAVLARPERALDATTAGRFEELLRRRLGGEPYAYLAGEREFYGRPFTVDPRVLVPRPETEHLVEAALALALPPEPRIVDVGTGSGCLAVTLAVERSAARVVATDVSPGALAVARRNAHRHGVAGRVALIGGDLLAPLALAAVDLLVSNPPYLASDDAATLSPEVRDHEPHTALFGGDDGLAVVRRLLVAALGLRPGVHVLLELGAGQAAIVAGALPAGFELVQVIADYAGFARIVVLKRLAST